MAIDNTITLFYAACPADRVFNSWGTGCPNTCWNPKASEDCLLPSTRTCDCPDGMVIGPADQCVPVESCQCTDDHGQSHLVREYLKAVYVLVCIFKVGETWISDECAVRFICTYCEDCEEIFTRIDSEDCVDCEEAAECTPPRGFYFCDRL
jgi:hypothetical protein